MIIDSADRQWSIDFVKAVVATLKLFNRTEQLEELFEAHKTLSPCQECPYWIFTYEDMTDDDPYQEICRENEVVLSKAFVGDEEEMQVLTCDELKVLVSDVISESQEETSSQPRPPRRSFLRRK